MSAPPLTHHDILALVEPFARRERRVDLAASDRIARRLVFHDGEARGPAGPIPGLRELLTLDSPGPSSFRLTRVLTRDDGLSAALEARGSDPARLLAAIEAVEPQQHFRDGPGHAIARSYEYDAFLGAAATAALVLDRGTVRVDGLTLKLRLPAMRGMSADLTLESEPGAPLALPDDLLAVIGWDWARLIREGDAWRSKLRLRGGRPRRSERAERALDQAAAHLARVLSEPPARFHERHVGARWGVVLRRGIPTLTAVGMIVGALLLARSAATPVPGMLFVMHYASIALIALSFCLQELPRFEIPPLPRRSGAADWRLPVPKPAGTGAADAARAVGRAGGAGAGTLASASPHPTRAEP